MVDMENGSFLGEFIPEGGSGKEIAEGVKKKLIEKGIQIEKIRLICGDSTNSNTGYKDGSWILDRRVMRKGISLECMYLSSARTSFEETGSDAGR